MRASQYPEAAFLAGMTASATHEVRNVLAIIKESAGLIEDMILLCSKRGTLDEEKVTRAVRRIDAQVKRGAELLTNLNRLSHSLDQNVATVDLHREVDQIVFLCERLARKKGQSLGVREMTGEAPARVDPLRLQMALFTAMERCTEELPEGASITVGAESSGKGSTVTFHGDHTGGATGSDPSDEEAWAYLGELAISLGATVGRGEAGFEIRISFRPE